jgi:hypothetical protein
LTAAIVEAWLEPLLLRPVRDGELVPYYTLITESRDASHE